MPIASNSAATTSRSRLASVEESLRSWLTLAYRGPAPLLYATDCCQTRLSPHGSADANHTAIAAPTAAAR